MMRRNDELNETHYAVLGLIGMALIMFLLSYMGMGYENVGG